MVDFYSKRFVTGLYKNCGGNTKLKLSQTFENYDQIMDLYLFCRSDDPTELSKIVSFLNHLYRNKILNTTNSASRNLSKYSLVMFKISH